MSSSLVSSIGDFILYLRTTSWNRIALFLFVAALGATFGIGYDYAAKLAARRASEQLRRTEGVFTHWQGDVSAIFTKAGLTPTILAAFAQPHVTTPMNFSASGPDRRTAAGTVPHDHFTSISEQLYAEVHGVWSVALLAGGVYAQCYPPGVVALGTDMLAYGAVDVLKKMAATRDRVVEGPMYLYYVKGYGVITHAPVFASPNRTEESFWGSAVVNYNVMAVIEGLGLPEAMAGAGMDFAVWMEDTKPEAIAVVETTTAPVGTSSSSESTAAPTTTAEPAAAAKIVTFIGGSPSIAHDTSKQQYTMDNGLAMSIPNVGEGIELYLAICPSEGVFSSQMRRREIFIVIGVMLGVAISVGLLLYTALFLHFLYRHRHAPPAGTERVKLIELSDPAATAASSLMIPPSSLPSDMMGKRIGAKNATRSGRASSASPTPRSTSSPQARYSPRARANVRSTVVSIGIGGGLGSKQPASSRHGRSESRSGRVKGEDDDDDDEGDITPLHSSRGHDDAHTRVTIASNATATKWAAARDGAAAGNTNNIVSSSSSSAVVVTRARVVFAAVVTLRGAQPIIDRSPPDGAQILSDFFDAVEEAAARHTVYVVCPVGDRSVYVVSASPFALMSFVCDCVSSIALTVCGDAGEEGSGDEESFFATSGRRKGNDNINNKKKASDETITVVTEETRSTADGIGRSMGRRRQQHQQQHQLHQPIGSGPHHNMLSSSSNSNVLNSNSNINIGLALLQQQQQQRRRRLRAKGGGVARKRLPRQHNHHNARGGYESGATTDGTATDTATKGTFASSSLSARGSHHQHGAADSGTDATATTNTPTNATTLTGATTNNNTTAQFTSTTAMLEAAVCYASAALHALPAERELRCRPRCLLLRLRWHRPARRRGRGGGGGEEEAKRQQ